MRALHDGHIMCTEEDSLNHHASGESVTFSVARGLLVDAIAPRVRHPWLLGMLVGIAHGAWRSSARICDENRKLEKSHNVQNILRSSSVCPTVCSWPRLLACLTSLICQFCTLCSAFAD